MAYGVIIGINGKIGSGKDTVANIIRYLDTKRNIVPSLIETIVPFSEYDEATMIVKTDWEIKKFGYKVKQIASLLTGIPIEKFEDQDFKDSNLGEEWTNHEVWFDTSAHKDFSRASSYGYIQSIDKGENYLKILKKEHENGDGWVKSTSMKVRDMLQRIGTDCMRNRLHINSWVNSLFADYKSYSLEGKIYAENESKWIISDLRFTNEFYGIKDRKGICIRVIRPDNPYPKSKHISETALDKGVKFDYEINNSGNLEDLQKEVEITLELMKINKHI